ncbi:MAG: PAS domain-containing protein, partial [Geminicoccales bacterium]
VTPLRGAREGGFLLVSFEDEARPAPAADRDPVTAPSVDQGRMERAVETEVGAIREELKRTIEELETSNEELKASNEEITSMNEEFQSANEELETSKEELQSLNEELNTLNDQLHEKVAELERTTNNLSNLLASTDIATIFLDRELRIRWFTPATRALLDLLPQDIGRPIGHFAQKFANGDLVENARRALETLAPIEGEVQADGNRWYMRRILPYRAEDDRVDGVVATFTDITRRKEAERQQRLLVAELRHRVRNILAAVRSIARETAENKETVEGFTEAFDARLDSLARVQNLISENVESEVELDALVREELLAHAVQEGDGVSVDGPDVTLRPRAAQMLALALNELATNAIKYGALAAHDGRLAISWSVQGRPRDRRLSIRWLEQGIPVRGLPSERGFGMELIEKGLPYSLGGSAYIDITRRNVTCVIEIPAGGNLAAVAGRRLDDKEEQAGA